MRIPTTLLAAMLIIAIALPAHAMKPPPRKPKKAPPIEVAAPDATPVTDVKKDDEGEMPPVIEPPSFARYKKPMPDILLRYKDEGFYVTPFPIIGVDPDTGINIGVAGIFYQNGKKDSPFFRITPYRWQINTAVLVTSNGLHIQL